MIINTGAILPREWNMKTTYPVQDIGPTFKGHALEHSQHWKSKVVKVSNSEIRTFPIFPAVKPSFSVTLKIAAT